MRININAMREAGLHVEEQSEGVYDIHAARGTRGTEEAIVGLLESLGLMSGTIEGDATYQGIDALLDEALVLQTLREINQERRA